MASMFAMFRALPFVPVAHVPQAFVALKDQILEVYGEVDRVEQFVTYVENTYIGELLRNNRRRAPLYPIELWNVYDRTVAGSPRTNNSVEGCHNRLCSFLNCHHPGFFKFIRSLREFLVSVESDLISLEAGNPPRALSVAWRRLEQRRVQLTDTFDESNPLEYLKNMARTLAAL